VVIVINDVLVCNCVVVIFGGDDSNGGIGDGDGGGGILQTLKSFSGNCLVGYLKL